MTAQEIIDRIDEITRPIIERRGVTGILSKEMDVRIIRGNACDLAMSMACADEGRPPWTMPDLNAELKVNDVARAMFYFCMKNWAEYGC